MDVGALYEISVQIKFYRRTYTHTQTQESERGFDEIVSSKPRIT